MMEHKRGEEESQGVKGAVRGMLHQWIRPLVLELDAVLDKRLVRTFLQLLEVILAFRHNSYGLLLSELGGYLSGGAHAPAGIKRISNLIRQAKWQAGLVQTFIAQQADAHLRQMEPAGDLALAVWDKSVWEKAESMALEGLCPVRSSKAHRLSRLKPGYYRPPSAPIFVPGQHWVGVVLAGLRTVPMLVTWQWWTTRGPHATTLRAVETALLRDLTERWGSRLVHLFDRGFAGEP